MYVKAKITLKCYTRMRISSCNLERKEVGSMLFLGRREKMEFVMFSNRYDCQRKDLVQGKSKRPLNSGR